MTENDWNRLCHEALNEIVILKGIRLKLEKLSKEITDLCTSTESTVTELRMIKNEFFKKNN
jgi:archaellum component FlaC